ncbi:MAG: ATP-binding protein [Actinomycetales bacterium]
MRRSLVLEPEPQSVPRARRLVRETLDAGGVPDAIDDAALLVSELVTNVVLHAGTAMAITVDVREDVEGEIRVEVLDHNPRIPQQRDYGSTAATGRGLQLVAALADDFGIDELPGNGKTMWFTLRVPHGVEGRGDSAAAPAPPPATPAPATPAAPPTTPATTPAPPAADARSLEDSNVVRLAHAPVTLFRTWQAHADALLREFTLASYGDEVDFAALDELTIAHGAAAALFDQVGRSLDGTGFRDLELQVRAEEAPSFVVLDQVLTHAAQLAGQGRLLAPPSQPEIARLRHWACTQCSAQALGNPGEAWDERVDLDAPPLGLPPDYDPAEVRAADRALIAADDTNRILAVSGAAGELLGWDATALEGLRLVVVIPERLREAHIAGFVRHLLTGEARHLGRPMRVEALRRDGSEVAVDLVLSRTESRDGRAVFLAELVAV